MLTRRLIRVNRYVALIVTIRRRMTNSPTEQADDVCNAHVCNVI